MCKKRTRFIESRGTVMARRGRRGAIKMATLRHVLEKRDELGKTEGIGTDGLNTLSFLKLVWFLRRLVDEAHIPVTHMIV